MRLTRSLPVHNLAQRQVPRRFRHHRQAQAALGSLRCADSPDGVDHWQVALQRTLLAFLGQYDGNGSAPTIKLGVRPAPAKAYLPLQPGRHKLDAPRRSAATVNARQCRPRTALIAGCI